MINVTLPFPAKWSAGTLTNIKVVNKYQGGWAIFIELKF
jgi:hypothetical protein